MFYCVQEPGEVPPEQEAEDRVPCLRWSPQPHRRQVKFVPGTDPDPLLPTDPDPAMKIANKNYLSKIKGQTEVTKQ
jgi:hypothetical protein